MAFTLKKKTITIIVIVVLVLSLGATGYIMWRVQREEPVTPDEGEAGGLTVGQYGCVYDSDCASAPNGSTECDEVMGNDPNKQRCEYYRCDTGYELSSDRLECTLIVEEEEEYSCGESGCTASSECVDSNNICSGGKCVLQSCPTGYEMSSDKCSCTEIEPECGDGEFNVTGEECEYGNPSGYECLWSACNQTTCRCPEVEEEEEESTTPTDTTDTDTTSELPETGISDLPREIRTFYSVFFVSGGILILTYIFESPKKKWQNKLLDEFEK